MEKKEVLEKIVEVRTQEVVNEKQIVEVQKHLIEEKHTEITDSINYAERIQRSFLASKELLDDNLKDYFVFFKPKDVVSGDFYWFSRIEKENTSFLAVVDCTGHGVPGAFMSMIGNTLLGEIVNHEKIYETNEILRQLHEGVRDSLKQNNNQNTDGMDISLCRIESLENGEYKIQFSGAKSQLYLYKDEEITEIRGDRKSIGGWQREAIRSFSKQELILKKGDCLFLATDGYTDAADQKRKKIGYKVFKKTLAENAHLSMKEQGAALLEILYEHQKGVEQRDDITLIGVRL
jgi:serine phosphatase RsbU (regulator of sigma subunit)